MTTSNKKISLITAAALTIVFSQGAMASEYSTSAENALNSNDLSFAFAQTEQPVQVLALSEREMKETEGAFGPAGAVVGGLWGGAQYLSSCSITGTCSWGGFGYNVATSAGLGAIGGGFVTLGRAAWGFNASIGAGIGNGVGTTYGWW